MKRMALILLACLALAVAGCGGSDDSSDGSEASTATSAETTAESSSKEKTKPKVTVPKNISPNKFAINELEEGTGATAKAGDQVTVQYVGVGYDTEKEFDSSWSRNEPFSFTLGAGEVIEGWDKGIVGMKVGGRRELLIPGKLAYGATGSPPKIGPNETLIFVVDLLAVE